MKLTVWHLQPTDPEAVKINGNLEAISVDECVFKAGVLSKEFASGAIVDLGENQGRTPFHLATENGDLAIIKLLVGHKADVNTNDANGWGPVHFASR